MQQWLGSGPLHLASYVPFRRYSASAPGVDRVLIHGPEGVRVEFDQRDASTSSDEK